MLSLQQWRAEVGPRAAGWTEAQVEQHRDRYYQLARALVGNFLASRRPSGEVGLQRVDRPRRPRRTRTLRRSA
jgi:hypothetical protein